MLSDANMVPCVHHHLSPPSQVMRNHEICRCGRSYGGLCYHKGCDVIDAGQPIFLSKHPLVFMELVLANYKWEHFELLKVSALLCSDSCSCFRWLLKPLAQLFSTKRQLARHGVSCTQDLCVPMEKSISTSLSRVITATKRQVEPTLCVCGLSQMAELLLAELAAMLLSQGLGTMTSSTEQGPRHRADVSKS